MVNGRSNNEDKFTQWFKKYWVDGKDLKSGCLIMTGIFVFLVFLILILISIDELPDNLNPEVIRRCEVWKYDYSKLERCLKDGEKEYRKKESIKQGYK